MVAQEDNLNCKAVGGGRSLVMTYVFNTTSLFFSSSEKREAGQQPLACQWQMCMHIQHYNIHWNM